MTGAARWLYFDTGEHDGKFNMDYDLRLAGVCRAKGVSALRVYLWKPYCISLGRNQDESYIDDGLAARDGLDIVRRPTGGKAVLHADEVTYSVVMPVGKLSVRDEYNRISSALVEGLCTLGADLQLAESSADFQKLFRDPMAIPCFSSSAMYEVEYHGRKLIGSAQHRFGDLLLQHGSILIWEFHKNIVKYLRVDEKSKAKTLEDLNRHTTTLTEILGRDLDVQEINDAVRSGFEKTFGVGFQEVPSDDFQHGLPSVNPAVTT